VIRAASVEDLAHIIELAARRHAASGAPGVFDAGVLARSLRQHVLPGGGCFVSDRGVIAGMLAPLWYDEAYRVAFEWFWWAEDGRGRDLLAAFEAWAVALGADEIRMSAVDAHRGGAVSRVLVGRGYQPFETSFRREAA